MEEPGLRNQLDLAVMAGQVKSRRTNNSVIDRFEENSLGVRDKGIGEVLMIKDYRNDDSFETETRN